MTITLTRHAIERIAEFGISPQIVEEIASRPDVTHTDTAGQSVRVCDRHPDWTVVVAEGIVITVLRRTIERWEHEPPGSAPRPVLPIEPPSPGGLGAEDGAMPVDPPRRVAPRRRRPTPALQARAVVVSQTVEPAVMEEARRLADGDPRRLRINLDGTVTVLNRPRGELSR